MRQRVGAQFTDHLGELIALSDSEVTLSTKSGIVRIPLADVHRAKRVPDLVGLERAAALAVPAPVVRWVGEWQLRAAEGFTSRANSALPLGHPGMPFSQAIEEVVSFYHDHDLPPRMDVPLPLGRPVARRLEAMGWTAVASTLVLAVDLPDLLASTPEGEQFELSGKPADGMLEMIKLRRGRLPGSALHVLTAVPQVAFAGYREEGALVCMARGTVTNAWLGLSFVGTAEGARRRGLARKAVGSLARWAHARAATRAFLQVQHDNDAALALYASVGFRQHHSYTSYTRLG